MIDPPSPSEPTETQEGAPLSPRDAGAGDRGRHRAAEVPDGSDGTAAATPWPPAGARRRRVDVGEVELDVVETGPESGPPVVLLHGFPEFSFGWRHQLRPLAAAGFRVLAPDQRGYAGSDRPDGIGSYRVDRLAGDVIGLLDACGLDRAHVAGHDWGAIVAWWTALAHPDRVDRLAILNVPHPAVMRRALRRSPRQMLRSSYILLFQLPRLPEALLRPARFRPLVRGMVRSARAGTFAEEELERYREAWSRPGALTSMLHWYRALRRAPELPAAGSVRPPTLLLWGARDAFLGAEMATPSIAHCPRGRLEMLEDCTHWLQHEAPGRINGALIRHFLAADSLGGD